MLLHRSFVDGLAHASYLIACERTKSAAVVDPQRDVEPYLDKAEQLGVHIEEVWLTHLHADFVAGHLELAERCGAKIRVARRAEVAFPHVGLEGGEEWALGELRVKALHTPGHTPESMCLFVQDAKTGERRLFTGDTLFVGDVGRPDLFGAARAKELAGSLYDSITGGLFPLGDDVTVAPAHGAGSLCGKNVSQEPFSTLGKERAENCALKGKQKDAFVTELLSELPPAPPQFARNAQTNKKGPALLRSLPLPRALWVEEAEQMLAAGAVMLDVRGADAFKLAHVPGSLFLGGEPSSQTWASWFVPPDVDLILVSNDGGAVQEARRKLNRVGFDRVVGFLNCGVDAWEHAGRDVGCLRDLAPRAWQQLHEKGDAPRLLDVRQPGEWKAGHAQTAQNHPLGLLPQVAEMLVGDGPLALICASGYRSVIGCSVLMRAGKTDVVNVPGGFRGWVQAGLPTAR